MDILDLFTIKPVGVPISLLILVFISLLIVSLLILSFVFLFVYNNILLSYMTCEFIAVLLVFGLLWHPYYAQSLKLQANTLLFLGLVAAELAVGLVVFIKYYRSTKNMVWSGE